MPTPVVRFRIDFGQDSSIGPGKIELLEGIRASGSLSQAARDLGLSYRQAWLLLSALNTSFQEPVTVSKTGGTGGGGVEVTPFGASVIDVYRALEKEISSVAARHLNLLKDRVSRHKNSSPLARRRPLRRKKISR